MLTVKNLSHLAKVFPDKIFGCGVSKMEGAKNQELSYQIALEGEGEYALEICSTLPSLKIYKVGYVYSGLPIYEPDKDEGYLTRAPGYFPDVLLPFDGKIKLEKGKNESIWITIPEGAPVGNHLISAIFHGADGDFVGEAVSIKIRDIFLPRQYLYFTQWVHYDCIASAHGVEIFSEEHWALIEKYVRLAVEHGMNMLLTPVLTPPLDTEVGSERPTVQLVDITVLENGDYSFDFSRLARFVKMARDCGIEHFEINHLFTQWGAEHAPKVMATVNGEYKKIFGWETDALEGEYPRFLEQLIPSLIYALTSLGVDRGDIFFHISDEPSEEHAKSYHRAGRWVMPLILGCNQIDAISSYDTFKKVVIVSPVVGIDHIEPFNRANVPNLWGYYCCAQWTEVSNRFLDMPSARNRIIGTQIFKYDLVGFLHWGYNFYYTQLSKRRELNPYEETDAGGAFPSGDAFSVYPLKNDVAPSIRQKVFKYALDDARLLSLVEAKIGTLSTHRLINGLAGMDVTFKNYPTDEAFFDNLVRGAFDILEEKIIPEEIL